MSLSTTSIIHNNNDNQPTLLVGFLMSKKFYVNVDKYGNTSAASIPIALSELFEKGLINKGDKIILAAFGGGVTWASTLIKF